jgi:hypothetical protein
VSLKGCVGAPIMTTRPWGALAAARDHCDTPMWAEDPYFKAIKTGCPLEKRQVGSFDALRKVLALLAPIAYRLLRLRALHRQAEDAPASAGFDPVDLQPIARAQRPPTSPPKTLEQAYLLLARLGGHIKNSGPPGWLTLAAGYETLIILRIGWFLGREST